jgi:hypothetical protein
MRHVLEAFGFPNAPGIEEIYGTGAGDLRWQRSWGWGKKVNSMRKMKDLSNKAAD